MSPEVDAERARRWATVPVQRRVVGVVRTLTSLDRLRDVFPLLADDFRLEMRFTVAAGSPFAQDLTARLHKLGMPMISWERIARADVDLAIAPSTNGDLHDLHSPLLTLPHGAGYHKFRATPDGFAPEVSGLSRTQLTHNGDVVPSIIGLSHEDQLALLRQECPEALDRARVVGDPCYDRLRASGPMRGHYRRALGTGRRTCVLVSSTWGEDALFGRQPELAQRLLGALPADDYQVALVLHPNVWDEHNRWNIEQWTRRARAKGLVLVPPDKGWQAALVASDVAIADHGSVAFYASAVGKPLMFAEFGDTEIVPNTPMARLGQRTPRWETTADPRKQIDNAAPVSDHESLAAQAFAHTGSSARVLREAIYEQLSLPLPPWDVPAEPVEPFTP